MAEGKFDWPPLLAPGRHFFTLEDIEMKFVLAFDGESKNHREKLFLSLEEIVQRILRVKLPCRLCLDGSFLTKKPKPSDLDIVLAMDYSISFILTEEQRDLIDALNTNTDFKDVDSIASFNVPHGHECYGSALDANEFVNGYGLEHSKQHVKGFVVLRLWETDVGLRICR